MEKGELGRNEAASPIDRLAEADSDASELRPFTRVPNAINAWDRR
jgi:hypothetical protein